MRPQDLSEHIKQLFPKCPVKSMAVFGQIDLGPWLKHGYRDYQFNPTSGTFDCIVALGTWDLDTDILHKSGILITDSTIRLPLPMIRISDGILQVYKKIA